MKKPRTLTPIAPLTSADLSKVTGGDTTTPPREPASGLPTGKRMHKPISST